MMEIGRREAKLSSLVWMEMEKEEGWLPWWKKIFPDNLCRFEHYGFVDDDGEVTTGEMVEQWAGGHKNYRFEEENGHTALTVEIDSVEVYLEYFQDKYPKTLEKLKEISER